MRGPHGGGFHGGFGPHGGFHGGFGGPHFGGPMFGPRPVIIGGPYYGPVYGPYRYRRCGYGPGCCNIF